MKMSVFVKGRISNCDWAYWVQRSEAAPFLNQIVTVWFLSIITDEGNLPANEANKREYRVTKIEFATKNPAQRLLPSRVLNRRISMWPIRGLA